MSSPFFRSLVTFLIVAGSSLLFCSKAIFVKMAYRFDLDAVTILALRMALALPFFLLGGWLQSRSNPDQAGLTRADWFRLALLGFTGWYVSSVLNFEGLKTVSVGLERMILYSYPSLVILGSVFLYRKPLRWVTLVAMVISYVGILVAYMGELQTHPGKTSWSGALFILGSALTYAIFVLLSGDMVKRIGAIRFTSIVVTFSCLFVLVHFALTHPIQLLWNLPSGAYMTGILLGVLGTVFPSYLLGMGLKRTNSQTFSIIGMIGPLGTVFLAWWLLGEGIESIQIVGLALTLLGGVLVSTGKA